MTLEEFMNKPKEMDFAEYQKKIDQLHKLEKRIKTLMEKIESESDSMSVFDDHSDPTYIKHKEAHEKYHAMFTKEMDKYMDLKHQLKGES